MKTPINFVKFGSIIKFHVIKKGEKNEKMVNGQGWVLYGMLLGVGADLNNGTQTAIMRVVEETANFSSYDVPVRFAKIRFDHGLKVEVISDVNQVLSDALGIVTKRLEKEKMLWRRDPTYHESPLLCAERWKKISFLSCPAYEKCIYKPGDKVGASDSRKAWCLFDGKVLGYLEGSSYVSIKIREGVFVELPVDKDNIKINLQ